MKRMRWLCLLVAGISIAFGFILSVFYQKEKNDVQKDQQRGSDIVLLNHISEVAAKNWDKTREQLEKSLQEIAEKDCPKGKHFSVMDLGNEVRYANDSEGPENLYDAMRKQMLVGDIKAGEQIVGKVILSSRDEEKEIAVLRQKYRVLFGCLFVMSFLVFGLLFSVKKQIIGPFEQLQEFAGEIAKGNLDVAIPQEKGGWFGPFSESFDLMRLELREAKKEEEQLKNKQKELITQLSHDLKTPVASIQSVTELLLLMNQKQAVPQEALEHKLGQISEKAGMLEMLISNILMANLEEMMVLSVHCEEEYSSRLNDLLVKSDYEHRIKEITLPNLLIAMDEVRMQQVFDNLISNSYKYSRGEIRVHATAVEIEVARGQLRKMLCVTMEDEGEPIPEEYLERLPEKFFRGENSRQSQGSGLGLYICRTLMEQMDGRLICRNGEKGLAVDLYLRII